MKNTQIFATGLCLVFGGLMFPACGSYDSSESESIGEVEEAVGEGAACKIQPGPDWTCDAWLTCTCMSNGWGVCHAISSDPNNCGGCGIVCTGGKTCQSAVCACPAGKTDCGGTCVDLQTDESHCGNCATTCGGGQTCATGLCGTSCTYQQDCPSGQICVGSFRGNDQVQGACLVKACTSDAQCTGYEPTGVISGWGATTPDNDMKCFPAGGGFCYASASDPHHCGPNDNDICATGAGKCGAGATCMTYNNAAHGCDGTCTSCNTYHAKTSPGYWRTCP